MDIEYPSQGRDFAHKQKAKHGQADARILGSHSPPQPTSRKRKAQHASINRVGTNQSITAGGKMADKTDVQPHSSSRGDCVRPLAKQCKQPSAAAQGSGVTAVPVAAAHAEQHHEQPGQLPLPGSSLEATVSGIPHTQIVQHALQQLNKARSSQPLFKCRQPGTEVQGGAAFVRPGTGSAEDTRLAVLSVVSVVSQAPAVASIAATVAPVLQPFLSSVQAERPASMDSAPGLQGSLPLASPASASTENLKTLATEEIQAFDIDQGPENPFCTGVTEDSHELVAGQEQGHIAASPGGDEQQPAATSSALQQLISRAQKLKEQLDTHAERKANRCLTLLPLLSGSRGLQKARQEHSGLAVLR